MAMANASSTITTAAIHPPILSPVKIAIIGGGAAGLAAARVFSRQQQQQRPSHEREHVEICVFEKDDAIGGVWNHHPNHDSRPMYKNLRTNLPKEIMAYREFPWRYDRGGSEGATAPGLHQQRSFVTHQDVALYLQEYSRRFQLDRFIRKDCRVDQLTCLAGTTSGLVSQPSGVSPSWPKIRLDWTCTKTTTTSEACNSDVFDAVIVCNGHYSLPAHPKIPGLDEYFTGRTLHSIAYDNAQPFAGQVVLCIGGRASGSDIAREVSTTATTVYLSDTAFIGRDSPIRHQNVIWVPRTTKVLPDGRVVFGDSSSTPAIMPIGLQPVRVDTIIFCSGYDYSFPFINETSNLALSASQRRVQPLFEQLWHAQQPNLAFIGLPHSVVPFPLFEFQAEAVERQWRLLADNEDCVLLNSERLIHEATRDAASGGPFPGGRVPEDTHFLGSAQWDYCRRMADYGGVLNDGVDDYIATNKSIYDHATAFRKDGFPAASDNYRLICYDRDDERRSFTHTVYQEKEAP